MDDTKAIIKRFSALEGQRENWDTHFQELADYMLPRKADIVRKRSKGEKRMEQIFAWYAYQWGYSLVPSSNERHGHWQRQRSSRVARRH